MKLDVLEQEHLNSPWYPLDTLLEVKPFLFSFLPCGLVCSYNLDFENSFIKQIIAGRWK